ncbi:MAG: L-serine ammonia-lyase [Clostridia bacterium]|nr:L-serine ammonia-lyase [Clostridia bacterium]
MKSLKELYKIGRGPSSSHTMGPEKAARLFEERNPEATSFKAVLFGSLAQTGKGHGTDVVICKTFHKPTTVVFDVLTDDIPHPNTLDLYAFDGEKLLDKWRVISIGGGAIKVVGEKDIEPEEVYPHNTFEQIREYCNQNDLSLFDYVVRFEPDIKDYLKIIWERMQKSIWKGLDKTGVLPGGLNVERKAQHLFRQVDSEESPETRENRIVCAYAFAVSEQNAAGGTIVTAPTCGSSGILPAVLRYAQERHGFSNDEIIRALAVAGLIGNIVKTNASISGAECGCQAECGTACSMAAAALATLKDMTIDQVEYAAEVAMEHHLGLTCDPVGGLVQIPCIERNAVSAMRAINATSLATFLSSSRQISFDAVVATMYATGKDLNRIYRETAEGGLAKSYSSSRLKKSKKK